MFTKEEIVKIWNDNKEFFNFDNEKAHQSYRGMYQKVESEFLFSLIKDIKPSKIIEISPNAGWTSHIMLKALKLSESRSQLLSFDLLGESEFLDYDDGNISRKLVIGDVKETITEQMIDGCDFLFMDSMHTEEFSKWYCETIISKLKKDTLILIHDWEGKEGDVDGEFVGVIKYAVNPVLIKRIFNVMDFVGENNLSRTPEYFGYAKGDRSPTEVCVKL